MILAPGAAGGKQATQLCSQDDAAFDGRPVIFRLDKIPGHCYQILCFSVLSYEQHTKLILWTDLRRQLYLLLRHLCMFEDKLAVSPSHSILTPGQPVLSLKLRSQTSGRAATQELIARLVVQLDGRWLGMNPNLPVTRRTPYDKLLRWFGKIPELPDKGRPE